MRVLLTDGFEPKRAKADDAGFDLLSPEDFVLRPGERRLQRCGFKIALPSGTFGMICPRSGNAWKRGVAVTNSPGILDAGYRDELGVILWHTNTHPPSCTAWRDDQNKMPWDCFAVGDCSCGAREPIKFKRGDGIAQLVVVELAPIRKADLVDHLEATDRAGGFGSTGRMPDAAPL